MDRLPQPAEGTEIAGCATSKLRTYAILLVEGFDLQAFAGCVEALELANRTSGCSLYSRTVVGEGRVVRSRSDIPLSVSALADVATNFDRLVIGAGSNAANYGNRDVLAWIRRVARAGASLCALEGGVWLLAHAGLAKNRRLAVPWESQAALHERYSDVDVVRERYLLDSDLSSAVGGVAAFEMMVEWIRRDHGNALAEAVATRQAATMIPARGRPALGLAQRLRVSNAHLMACLDLMEDHVEVPLQNNELAAHLGLSARHLERLFRHQLGASPYQFYRRVRLEQAKRLVQQTQMKITEIAMATGFVSASHFGRSFREAFGESPSCLRDRWSHTIHSGAASSLL